MSDITLYEENVKQGGLPLLGGLLWYSVRQMAVTHHQWKTAVEKHGLDASSLPRPPSDSGVFKNVTTKIANAPYEVLVSADPEIWDHFLVRPVGSGSDDPLLRRIVRERKNNTGKRLEYEELGEIQFFRKGSQLKYKSLSTSSETTARRIFADVQSNYDKWRGKFDSNVIRIWLHKEIQKLGATRVHPNGGLYFIPISRRSDLEKIEAVCMDLGQGSHIFFHVTPLPDTTNQRAMLKAAFEDELVVEVNKILAELKTTKNLTKTQQANYLSRLKELESRTNEMVDVVETNLETCQARLEIFKRSLTQAIFNTADD